MMSANNRIRFGLKIAFVCLYITPSQYHHCGNLSEDIELIKCQIYFVGCKIEHILAVTHYTICGDVCFQLTHFPCDDWENIYTLSYHRQIGSMVCTFTHCTFTHCTFTHFTVRSWNNGMRCMSFYSLMNQQCDLEAIQYLSEAYVMYMAFEGFAPAPFTLTGMTTISSTKLSNYFFQRIVWCFDLNFIEFCS